MEIPNRIYCLQLPNAGLDRLETDFMMSPALTLEKETQLLHAKSPAESLDKVEAAL